MYKFNPPKVKTVDVKPITIRKSEDKDLDIWSLPGPVPPLKESDAKALKRFVPRAISLKKRLEETNADNKTIIRETKKIREEFYKEFIKEFPKDKEKIKKLKKEEDEFLDMKIKLQEIINIYKQRPLTKKEERELKNLQKRFQNFDRRKKNGNME